MTESRCDRFEAGEGGAGSSSGDYWGTRESSGCTWAVEDGRRETRDWCRETRRSGSRRREDWRLRNQRREAGKPRGPGVVGITGGIMGRRGNAEIVGGAGTEGTTCAVVEIGIADRTGLGGAETIGSAGTGGTGTVGTTGTGGTGTTGTRGTGIIGTTATGGRTGNVGIVGMTGTGGRTGNVGIVGTTGSVGRMGVGRRSGKPDSVGTTIGPLGIIFAPIDNTSVPKLGVAALDMSVGRRLAITLAGTMGAVSNKLVSTSVAVGISVLKDFGRVSKRTFAHEYRGLGCW